MQPPHGFNDDKAVTEALCAALVRYVGFMVLVSGQDALDALALVRDETLQRARQAGMLPSHNERLNQLFIQAAQLALKGSGKPKPH
jgi:hypothetical protein